MQKLLLILMILAFFSQCLHANERQVLTFKFQDETLEGVYDKPIGQEIKGTVLLIHGYGETNVVEDNWHLRLREVFVKSGYATFIWDKMGCGNSTGKFDVNQSVENSANEALAAIKMLKLNKPESSSGFGLWGISRAGWINPLIIEKAPEEITFWISVSGVDGLENFGYLLEQNLILEGNTQEYAKQVKDEWLAGIKIAHEGGSYPEYKQATPNLGTNRFWKKWTNGGISVWHYGTYKKAYMEVQLDDDTGLQIYIPDFDKTLSQIKVPVLAVFGEKDMNVDWRKTKRLYERIFDSDQLSVISFEHCNHNLWEAKTGSVNEFEAPGAQIERCKGYLSEIEQWLKQLKLN